MEGFTTKELLEHLKDVQEFQELMKIQPNNKGDYNTFYSFSGNVRFKVIFKKNNNIYHEIPLFIKFASTSLLKRERFSMGVKFSKELYFFSNLLPNMADKIRMPELTDLFPKCYYSFGISPREFLALKDVSYEGFHPIENLLNADLGSLQMALTALAKFHAAGIVFKWNHRQEFNYVSTRYNSQQNLQSFFQIIWVDGMKDRGIEAARKDGIDIPEDFENKFYSIVLKFSKCVKETSPWYTIVHGDSVINNILFNNTQAKLVDLQLFCCASVCYDLVSLICVSTEKDFRDKYLDSLLLQYYRELICTISRLTNLSKADLESRGLNFKSLKRNFHLHLPFAYRLCCYFLAMLIDMLDMHKVESDEYSDDEIVLKIKNLHLGGQEVDHRLSDIVKEIIEANVVDELYEVF